MGIPAAYHWLVEAGLWRDLVSAGVYSLFGALVATLITRPLKKIHQRLTHVEDQLDTSTPGGLTDVVDSVADAVADAVSAAATRRTPPHGPPPEPRGRDSGHRV